MSVAQCQTWRVNAGGDLNWGLASLMRLAKGRARRKRPCVCRYVADRTVHATIVAAL